MTSESNGDDAVDAERWRQLIASSQYYFLILDSDLRFVFINQTQPHLSPAQLVGQLSPLDFIPSEDVDRVRTVLRGVLESGQPASYDVQVPMDGLWYRTEVMPLRRNGVVDQLILITSNLSSLKQAQAELEARNRELTDHKARLDEQVVRRTQELQTAYTQLEAIARHDAVTGLLTRREVLARLDEEVERARRYGSPLSILMLDLDHFKDVNDTYGHVAGDRVLAAAGRVLTGALRTSDHAGRYGGEELLAVIPETAIQGATEAARRILDSFAALAHQSDAGSFQVTCSIGVASLDAAMTPEALLIAADKALYQAKAAGRNTVVAAPG